MVGSPPTQMVWFELMVPPLTLLTSTSAFAIELEEHEGLLTVTV
mgnify:CR=1 FL=1